MRRPLAPVLLSLALLSACASDPSTVAEPPQTTKPSAKAGDSAGTALPGLEEVTEELSRAHEDGPLEYETVPPLGGTHNPRWLACDVYDEPVPDEFAVHSLEHGAVWFAHDPDLPQEQRAQLAELAKRKDEHVLVSPVEGLDAPIVAAAWGLSLEVEDAGDERLGTFLELYAGGGQGGEPGAPCKANGVTPREARGLLGTSGTSA